MLVDGDFDLTQSGVMQDYVTEKTGKFGGETPEDSARSCAGCSGTITSCQLQAGMTRFLMNFLPEDKRPEGGDRLHARASESRLCRA